MGDRQPGQPGTRFSPRYGRWARTIILGVPTASFTLAVAYLAIQDWDAGSALLGVAIFATGISWSVLPRAYVLQVDRLRIILGWPWSLNVPFSTIDEFCPGRFIDAVAYWSLRLIPSVRGPVVVKRNRGLSIVISPADRKEFLVAAQTALEAYRTRPR